jgi:hypothetical protein
VLLTEGGDADLAETLGGLEHVHLAGGGEGRGHTRRRHRLTPDAFDDLVPAAGVVFGGAPESLEDLEAMRGRDIPLFIVQTALAGPLRQLDDVPDYEDAVAPALHELEWGAPRHDVVPDAERAVPYTYVMQRLVERLVG